MATKRAEYSDITEDLFLEDVDGGKWKNPRPGDNSKDKNTESGKRPRRNDRTSDEEYKESGSSRGSKSLRKMRGRYNREDQPDESGRYRRRSYKDSGSPFPKEESESNRRLEENEQRGRKRRSRGRKKSRSRDRSPVKRPDQSGAALDKEHKSTGNVNMSMSEKSHSRSRSSTRNKRSASRSSSGSSSDSRVSWSHSSDSSSSWRKSRGYPRHRSESKSPPKRFSPKQRARGDSPYNQDRGAMHQQQGWYQNQNFQPPPAQNAPNFQNIPMTHPTVYPTTEGSYNTNYPNQPFPNNYPQFPGYEAGGSGYYPTMGNNFPPNPPTTQDYTGGQGQSWDNMMYTDTSMPPPIQQQMQPQSLQIPNSQSQGNDSGQPRIDQKIQEAKKEAVEQELIQQKRTLSKQREDYLKKSNSLITELNRLKEQKRDLLQENSKDNERILRENAKLQKKRSMERSSSSPEVTEVKLKPEKPTVNLVHYDPELHWCSDCNVFPRTAIDYLNHLHTEEHKEKTATIKMEDLPWHFDQPKEKIPTFNKHAPNKRIPIRGLQFFAPATSWYCKLCKTWLGDMHCASSHLKSSDHCGNYSEYVLQNPHWEVDWLSDRTRAYERNSESKTRALVSESVKPEVAKTPEPERAVNLTSLSDQLLAMLAANNKGTRPEVKSKAAESDSSESSSSDSSSKKTKKKKRKKSKKKVKKEEKEEVSPKKSIPLPPDPPKQDSDLFVPEYDIPVKFPPQKKTEGDSDDKIIREWMAPPDSTDRELTSSLKGRLKQKHETEQQKRKEERYKDDSRRDRHDRRYRDYRDSRDYRESRESRRKEESDKSRDKKSPMEQSRGKYHDKDTASEPKIPLPEERWKNEKPTGKIWAPGKDDDDEIETIFEKRTSESAAKKKDIKKPPLMSLPKTKLPFIGRMPILKKKPSDRKSEENDGKEEKKVEPGKIETKEIPKSEEKKPLFVWPEVPNIPEPPILSEMQMHMHMQMQMQMQPQMQMQSQMQMQPQMQMQSQMQMQPHLQMQPQVSGSLLPKSTLIISKRPRLIDQESSRMDSRMRDDILGEQDMDIEEDAPKDELHKDFKDALELLFPGESTERDRSGEDKEKQPVTTAEEIKQQSDMGGVMSGYMTHAMMGQYMGTESMYATGDQQRYSYEQPPPPGMVGHSYAGYPGYMVDSSYMSAQSYGHITAPLPDVPPPPPPGLEDTGEDVEPPPPPLPPTPPPPGKRKNPLSQRMRRHLQKKKAAKRAAEEASEEGSEDDEDPAKSTDMSDLAMLGIDEEDITAQSFH